MKILKFSKNKKTGVTVHYEDFHSDDTTKNTVYTSKEEPRQALIEAMYLFKELLNETVGFTGDRQTFITGFKFHYDEADKIGLQIFGGVWLDTVQKYLNLNLPPLSPDKVNQKFAIELLDEIEKYLNGERSQLKMFTSDGKIIEETSGENENEESGDGDDIEVGRLTSDTPVDNEGARKIIARFNRKRGK